MDSGAYPPCLHYPEATAIASNRLITGRCAGHEQDVLGIDAHDDLFKLRQKFGFYMDRATRARAHDTLVDFFRLCSRERH